MTQDELRDFSLLYKLRADGVQSGVRANVDVALRSVYDFVKVADPSGLNPQERMDALDARDPGASLRFMHSAQGLRDLLRSVFGIIPPPAENEFVAWFDPVAGVGGVVWIPIPFSETRIIEQGQPSRSAAEAYRDTLVAEYNAASTSPDLQGLAPAV